MKNVLVFISGMISGAVLLLIVALFIVNSNDNRGYTMFEDVGECISSNNFRIIQVLDSGKALAEEITDDYSGILVLFYSDGSQSYYDDQIIKIPSGKCARQIGTYKYTTNIGMNKTVPIVDIIEE